LLSFRCFEFECECVFTSSTDHATGMLLALEGTSTGGYFSRSIATMFMKYKYVMDIVCVHVIFKFHKDPDHTARVIIDTNRRYT